MLRMASPLDSSRPSTASSLDFAVGRNSAAAFNAGASGGSGALNDSAQRQLLPATQWFKPPLINNAMSISASSSGSSAFTPTHRRVPSHPLSNSISIPRPPSSGLDASQPNDIWGSPQLHPQHTFQSASNESNAAAAAAASAYQVPQQQLQSQQPPYMGHGLPTPPDYSLFQQMMPNQSIMLPAPMKPFDGNMSDTSSKWSCTSSSTEKKFACPICSRSFARAYNRDTHVKTHEDRCQHCSRHFSRRHDLARHRVTVHHESMDILRMRRGQPRVVSSNHIPNPAALAPTHRRAIK